MISILIDEIVQKIILVKSKEVLSMFLVKNVIVKK